MDSSFNNTPPKQIANETVAAKYPPSDFPCRKIGMTWGFLLTYFLSLFGVIVVQKNNINWNFSLAIPLVPALYGAYVGFFAGKFLSGYHKPKFAAVAGCLLLNATFLPMEILLIIGRWTPYDSFFRAARDSLMLLGILAILIGTSGALLGGIVSIYKRNRLETGKNAVWPRFYLNEMFVGFFLITVILSVLTAIAPIVK